MSRSPHPAIPGEPGGPPNLAVEPLLQSDGGGGGQQAQPCHPEGEDDHGETHFLALFMEVSLWFGCDCDPTRPSVLQSLGLVMVHAHSRWIAEPSSINTTMGIPDVGIGLDHLSPRRIEPEKPLWHFYLTR